MKNENSIFDLFHSLLDEMKMGEACATILNDEYFTEDEQEDMFGELLLPSAILAFAEKYNAVDDDDGSSLQNYFDAFLKFENISDDFGNLIAATINELSKGALQGYIKSANADALKTINAPVDLSNRSNNDPKAWGRIVKRTKGVDLAKKRMKLSEADDDDDVGVIDAHPWDSLSNQDRILKVKAFLAAVAHSGDNHRDQKPFIKRGTGPDPYGNERGKAVKVFDRKTNRYGATDNPTTPKGTNSYLQRKPLPNLPIQEGLFDPKSNVERYVKWMNNNKTFINPGMSAMESPAEALKAAGMLKDEAEKRQGHIESDYSPDDYLFGRTGPRNKGKGRF